MGTPVKRDLSKNINDKKLRYKAIQDIALSIGAQSGLAWQSKNIDEQLMRQVSTLNKIYSFNLIILDHNILPPVLLEGRNVFNLADRNTIRIADRRYKIAKQAHFVTTAPTWRQYLWMDYMKPERPSESLLPQDAYEQQVWDYYVSIGWYEGVLQAGNIFSNNVARLKEDFSGMILYRKLLAQNMVSPPYVAQTELGITGDQGEINIDDQVLRITALPQLNTDSNDWNPVVAENKEEIQRYTKMAELVKGHPIATPKPTNQPPTISWQPVISNMANHE
jgi:defect in organelle trafficking protein DotC